jgi:hypothetical protein
MPYPITDWLEACVSVHYSTEWPISWWDYATAMCLVAPELGWREIITKVRVPGPDEIEIITLCRFEHALSAAGNTFTVKRIKGKWKITQRGLWVA